ncbi:hypothetical protein AB0A74_03080 [Saccharothrix sp. NPDC042600]|uniref:hypothetical protein n=1 Tax=Saccharothrix TaxID=2071 RepID=UPI0033E77AA9|nr:hypothetical protein GCM10017745_67600 [Saccharothrix mutabilis subsp. capreolus]
MVLYRDGVAASIGLQVPADVPVRLCGSLASTIFLVIGDRCEITLDPVHVRALAQQCATALKDSTLVAAAEEVLSGVYDAGAQARTAAERALRQAERAEQAKALVSAEEARNAAQAATAAAQRAQAAVEAASEAMQDADRSAITAETAAAAAKLAVERARSGR